MEEEVDEKRELPSARRWVPDGLRASPLASALDGRTSEVYLHYHAGLDRDLFKLRTASLLAVLLAFTWVAWMFPLASTPTTLALVLTILGGLAWLRLLRSGRRRMRAAADERWVLRMSPDGLYINDDAGSHTYAWFSIHSIEVDEESLRVRLCTADDQVRFLSPHFGDMGAVPLAQQLAAYRARALGARGASSGLAPPAGGGRPGGGGAK